MDKSILRNFPISGRVKYCLEFVKNANLKNKTILDLGSSFGWLEYQLKDEKMKIVGVEPFEEGLKFAKKNIKTADFIIGDALNIPLKDKSVNAVIFFDVIEHVPKGTELKALKEINRVLKKSGNLLLTTPNNHLVNNFCDPAWYFGHRHYETDNLKKLLSKAGFKVINNYKRGGYLTLFYIFWFYLMKRLIKSQPRSMLMEKLDDFSYRGKNGFVTHYFLAEKK